MALPTFRLDGGVALVTGAASGIGAGIAVGLAEFGAAVGRVDVTVDGLDQTVAAIEKLGGRAVALPADVTDGPALDATVARLESELGPLTVALNSADIHSNAPAADMARDHQWQRLIDVNSDACSYATGLDVVVDGCAVRW